MIKATHNKNAHMFIMYVRMFGYNSNKIIKHYTGLKHIITASSCSRVTLY